MQGRSLPFIDFMRKILDGEIRILGLIIQYGTFCIVTRKIIDQDDFLRPPFMEGYLAHLIKNEMNGPLFIVSGYDN
jgi:hypothetical protein